MRAATTKKSAPPKASSACSQIAAAIAMTISGKRRSLTISFTPSPKLRS